jgi:hypothetical protein
MTNVITVDNARSYSTEANLDKGLAKFGLNEARFDPNHTPCRYIKVKNAEGRWTAIFLVSEYFNVNKTGGYLGFAADRGFQCV